MTYKRLLIALGLLINISCGNAITLTDGSQPGGNFDPKLVEKVEKQFCSLGYSLKELSGGTDVYFGDLRQRSSIFAFSATQGKECIIKDNVDDSWMENGVHHWFNLHPNSADNCLKNNTIWQVVSMQTSGTGIYYTLKNLDDNSQQLLDMNATNSVRGLYASQRVGLKVLACQR
ncbi:hypothetical protein [Bdellovibrio sp. HCB337]|uniref:hypothetical protein n=1 Tax=Bdellovibrio sp. HCB337 TaxID=3394358 RepID=UPI0039A56FEF